MHGRVELPVDFSARQPEQPGAEIHVLAAGQLGVEPGAELDQRDHVSADAHHSARRPRDARDELEERRLAGAVASDDAEARTDGNLERDVAQRPDRRTDPAARGRVHFVRLTPQVADLGRDEVAKRTRTSGAVLLGDLIELDGNRGHQMTSAKYLSIFLN